MQAFKVKGITIHNTGNNLSAKENKKYLKENGKLNYCHFLVDEEGALKTQSLKKMAYHTGKGFDRGNMNTIAIEICRSTGDDETYFEAEKKAVELIKELMEKYSLTTKDIYFHRDFNHATYCPHKILSVYRNKRAFIEKYFKEGE